MTDKVILTMAEVDGLAFAAAADMGTMRRGTLPPTVYAIPRGGVPAALAIGRHIEFDFVDHPAKADFIVDDLIDSGAAMENALNAARHPGDRSIHREPPTPIVLVDKRALPDGDRFKNWLVFPWEGDSVGSFEDNIRRTLQFVGEDAERGGLAETPSRVAKAWGYWCGGYGLDPADILKTFEDGAQNVNEMVMVKNIPFYSHCEHHMAAFFGSATIAYIPDGRIVGLSKLNRLVDIFARRLQVQERLTTQIADALVEHLKPKGVGVIVNARHLCMESRGVRQQGQSTTTSALRGVMLEGSPRAEFLSLAKD